MCYLRAIGLNHFVRPFVALGFANSGRFYRRVGLFLRSALVVEFEGAGDEGFAGRRLGSR
jgi:hypothetical protein